MRSSAWFASVAALALGGPGVGAAQDRQASCVTPPFAERSNSLLQQRATMAAKQSLLL
eukprot:CAMPEP_0179173970 /NCGR_PEP_ID=MMETSP0796-20121207/85874_1 /TAXON_ID=73915 /ORGANISM="Pyrodinium bahamense, Strain pbaha01" /LENGTH=57 /DNA_ID=CAMNT_0020877237 /DNA_START=89 /DNA_END=258 /DNA_ORIENTATION=-